MTRQIEQLLKAQEYTERKGGKCLSTEYINVDSKLIWKCNNSSHSSWLANYYSVLKNKSSPSSRLPNPLKDSSISRGVKLKYNDKMKRRKLF